MSKEHSRCIEADSSEGKAADTHLPKEMQVDSSTPLKIPPEADTQVNSTPSSTNSGSSRRRRRRRSHHQSSKFPSCDSREYTLADFVWGSLKFDDGTKSDSANEDADYQDHFSDEEWWDCPYTLDCILNFSVSDNSDVNNEQSPNDSLLSPGPDLFDSLLSSDLFDPMDEQPPSDFLFDDCNESVLTNMSSNDLSICSPAGCSDSSSISNGVSSREVSLPSTLLSTPIPSVSQAPLSAVTPDASVSSSSAVPCAPAVSASAIQAQRLHFNSMMAGHPARSALALQHYVAEMQLRAAQASRLGHPSQPGIPATVPRFQIPPQLPSSLFPLPPNSLNPRSPVKPADLRQSNFVSNLNTSGMRMNSPLHLRSPPMNQNPRHSAAALTAAYLAANPLAFTPPHLGHYAAQVAAAAAASRRSSPVSMNRTPAQVARSPSELGSSAKVCGPKTTAAAAVSRARMMNSNAGAIRNALKAQAAKRAIKSGHPVRSATPVMMNPIRVTVAPPVTVDSRRESSLSSSLSSHTGSVGRGSCTPMALPPLLQGQRPVMSVTPSSSSSIPPLTAVSAVNTAGQRRIQQPQHQNHQVQHQQQQQQQQRRITASTRRKDGSAVRAAVTATVKGTGQTRRIPVHPSATFIASKRAAQRYIAVRERGNSCSANGKTVSPMPGALQGSGGLVGSTKSKEVSLRLGLFRAKVTSKPGRK